MAESELAHENIFFSVHPVLPLLTVKCAIKFNRKLQRHFENNKEVQILSSSASNKITK